jgi:c(7)-type cytochrome triheme protein
MKDAAEAKQKSEKVGVSRSSSSSSSVGTQRRALSLAVLVLFFACALVIFLVGNRAAAVTSEVATRPQPKSSEASFSTPTQDYSKFSHSYPGAHAALSGRWSCSICHTRNDNSAEPKFPGHKACISCHQTEFNTPGSPLCTICHTQEGLSQQNLGGLKKFPASLSGFRADFDHQQHSTGEARPQENCAACHAPARRGIARTIPAGLSAHQTCYQCHTPGRQSGGIDISSCGACHVTGRYGPTSANARSYGIGFSHADHGGRQRLNCDSCHTVARRGLPQGRQVSSTFPAQHFPNTRAQSCMTCHNGQRSFGETNFNDCKRCHTGPTFRL